MAFSNPNKPAGLAPVTTIPGYDWTGKGRMYAIPTSDATYNYFPGDLVTLAATPGGGDVNGLPICAMYTAGTRPVIGVIQSVGIIPQGGPYINPNNLALTYAPITKTQTYYAYVIDDPYVVYEIQEVGASTNLTTAVVGLNATIVLGAASTAAVPGVFVSQTQLNNAVAPTTTSTLPLKIISLAQRPDNHFVTSPTTGGGSQKWWVMLNNHFYSARPTIS